VSGDERTLKGVPDWVELDPRIRQEPADHTAAPSRLAQVLREAVDWREVLQRSESLKRSR
jgi:hypothetical protein